MNLIKPSFSTGYAKNASESANPNLWKGLVGAWMPSFGVTGNTLKDVSGNGNDGTLTNMDAASDWVGTSKGLALDFDGSNQSVQVNSQLITNQSEFSVVCFVKSNGTQNTYTCPISQGHFSFTGFAFQVGYPSTNDLRFVFGDSSNWRSASFSYAARTDKSWTMLCVTRTKNTIKTFRDGALVGSSSFNIVLGSYDFRVGQDYYNTDSNHRTWNGKIGFVGGYNRALSPSEIKQLYANPAAPFERKQQTVGISTAAAVPSANFNPFSVLTHPLEQ